ncbi:MAG: hypothetical protein K0S27_1358 [Gammaproteobacteria bacterium]|jgi:ribosome-binding ATPase YchF (GTP1/OBG family)|nr:hypothetical protein [Gammaproteobacteria bacterium]
MKKVNRHKYYSGNPGGYDPKKNASIINGELFTFDIQIKRKNGKIYVRETSNARTAFSRISESVRDDTKMNVSLLKSHLMSEVLQELERGFDRVENPIGKSNPEPSNNATFKPKDIAQQNNISTSIHKPPNDLAKKIKEINDNFEEEIEKSVQRIKKLDERDEEIEDSLKKKLEECSQKVEILLQLKEVVLMGENSEKKEALIKELEKLGVEGLDVIKADNFSDGIEKSSIKKNIH